ncbi:hypothetical protein RR49_00725 [Microbacterium ginsengisoli]|uniref:Uncharacterized protein n=2 Tax=Actinomycetes TaxID=1760 RepID=A0A0F0LZC3_9MICO|nr:MULTISPECIES: circularly permuted type 2 ATP-grasp protein [Microbacterium]KJL38318.1 hypothetical protein RR49_00725 [Microbacterium ginsengisoli]ODU77058.1 MAG: hypothetical protein ABT08_07580 [Microbacterium sp. SCN 71-21]
MTVIRDYAATLAQPALPLGGSGFARVRYDEVIAPDGTLREAWKAMAESVVALTPAELQRAEAEVRQFLVDDGVTYAPAGGDAQPWQLDPVPLVLAPDEWTRIEAGLAQRAELFDAILADLYGPQTLLADGSIPAAAVFGHAGYVRSAVRAGTGETSLFLLASDLGRDASGEWCVLTDRTQAPSGLGYARENRRVISQVLPELYQEHRLHRMDPYFAALRQSLLSAAEGVADPRVVILTPGALSETAYDQAYLAGALGFPLVQGSDLVVWEGWLWVKPSGWPEVRPTERVDVILRRVDAAWCDPLTQRSDSRLGVAGLVEVIRRGRVRVVNGLGASVLENPALSPVLPELCERLLGEQLRLSTPATWWGGDATGLEVLLARLDDESFAVRTIDGAGMPDADASPDAVRALIRENPWRWAGHEVLTLSQAPVCGADGQALAAPVTLRTFTLRHGSTYRPLVGGLANVAHAQRPGRVSKDVWVMKSTPGDPDQGLLELEPVSVSGVIPALGPRAIEDMWWIGRYAERAEDLLRLVVAVHTHADRLPAGDAAADDAVLVAMAAIERLIGRRPGTVHQELRSAIVEASRPGTAAQSLAQLRFALEAVRDQLSNDVWRSVAASDRALGELRASGQRQIADGAGRMLTGILSLQAVTANMIRDDGWLAIEAGRWIERSLQVCLLLRSTVVEKRERFVELSVLEMVLASAESAVTQRRRYRGNVRVYGVLELLLLDARNPRSVAFALGELRARLTALPRSTGSTRPERLLEQLEQTLAETDAAALASTSDGHRDGLERLLDDTIAQLRLLAEAVADLHFASGPTAQPITALSLTELLAVAS